MSRTKWLVLIMTSIAIGLAGSLLGSVIEWWFFGGFYRGEYRAGT